MIELGIKLPEGFLNEEVRCDYVITSKMKKVWAIELDLLSELVRVCEKYNITYYADSGTLIGAVRHKGFIPWDDDIDIVMMRNDYNKFLKVAEQEFKYPIFLQNTYTDEKYLRGHSQLRNSETTGCILEDVDRPFNRGIFIDIFPMDHIPDGKIQLYFHKKRLMVLWRMMSAGLYYKRTDRHTVKGHLFGLCMKGVFCIVDYKKCFKYYEKLCSKYNDKKCKRISYIEYSLGKEKHLWERKWFRGAHKEPFEMIHIAVPDGYDARLTKEYGDYMTIHHAETAHGGVIFEPEIPYQVYFKQ